MRQISILGCGWLGFPLAGILLKNGFTVKGSTTTESKVETLKESGILPYLISLKADVIPAEIDAFLDKSEILIINIPPQLRGAKPENFVLKVKNLIPFIEKSSVRKILFISSISVYNDTFSEVSEDTEPNPGTETGKQLLQSEKLLQENVNFKTTVLRFGGLVGGNRHPAYSLSGKTNIENPKSAINLIHREDCIRIIERIIEKEKWGEVFNAVAPFHPSREEYYKNKATDLNLALPEFNSSNGSPGKIISSQKIQAVLDYTFKITDNL